MTMWPPKQLHTVPGKDFLPLFGPQICISCQSQHTEWNCMKFGWQVVDSTYYHWQSEILQLVLYSEDASSTCHTFWWSQIPAVGLQLRMLQYEIFLALPFPSPAAQAQAQAAVLGLFIDQGVLFHTGMPIFGLALTFVGATEI